MTRLTPVRLCRGASLLIAALALTLAAAAAVVGEPLPTAPPADEGSPPIDGTPAEPAPVPRMPPTLSIAEASARRAVCDDYVAAIAGRAADPSLLEKDEVRALIKQVPDLATCGAIATDSRAVCQVFAGQRSEMKDCVGMWSVFHEVRTYPKGRSYMFDEAMVEDCRTAPPVAALCDPFRDALRSGKPADCAQTGPLASVCRAYLAFDPSLCLAPAPELEGLEEDCRKQIKAKAVFAKGLKAIAASGAGRERAFAKAAMGDRAACDAFAKTAMDACVAAGQPPAGSPAPAASPPAATPAAPATGAPAASSGMG